MPTQVSFSELEYAAKKKVTRRDRLFGNLESMTPWAQLLAVIEPHYPKVEGAGRRPIGVERMLRMYVAQQCLGLSDEGIEDAIYDSQAVRRFVGIDLSRETAPDATTLLKFRRLLEANDLPRKAFEAINERLAAEGLLLRKGTIVDATIIAAPSSTKNKDKARDPEMHSTQKGNQWHFGMKAHIGVDADSGLTHSLVTTAANVNDVTKAHELLHGEELCAIGDAGYQGVEKRAEAVIEAAGDAALETGSATQVESGQEEAVTPKQKAVWIVAMRPGKRRALPDTEAGRSAEAFEKAKASIRAKVEHPFHVVKNLFRHRKTRYRGLAKNTAQLYTLFGLANLLLARRVMA
jgi:IS5 family transposase